jgi:hypothetical protein
LRVNKDIRILDAEKGKCTVMLDEFKYGDKLNTLPESGISEPSPKDPRAKYEKKVQKLVRNTKLLFILS